MTFFYCVVARGATPLCSHQVGAGNYAEVIHSMLPNIPTRNNAKTTYTSNDSCVFHVMVENGIIYMCATDSSCTKLKAYGFLTEIKNQFSTGSLAHRAHFALANELDRDFAPVLEMQMEEFSRADAVVAGGNTHISKLQSQVNEVKDVMTQNIEKVLQRGERLEDLLDKTEDLEASANTFRKTSSAVTRKMWWKNMKMKLILALVIIVILIIIIIGILYGAGVLPPKSNKATTTVAPTTTHAALL